MLLIEPKVLGGTLAARSRWYRLRVARMVGRVQAMKVYHWLPLIGWLGATALTLALVQFLVNHVFADFPIWGWFDTSKPHLDVLSFGNVLIAYLVVILVRWLTRARERVVIDDFVDFTTDDARAVSGMATLLATELSRLRALYTSINETLAVPVAVGVHTAGSTGHDAEPGAFLTVRADDLSDMLKGAVASEAKIHVGPLLIPIGSIVALFGQLVRGPRVLGSVHRTDSGGGPTLTAQILGARQKRTWRVDRSGYSATSAEEDKAFLDQMVRELAIQMFTDLTLRGSVRWRAIKIFTDYLRRYHASMRTPKTRTRFLKDAEEKLLEGITEDESFDFAYYNLGVIYSELAQEELATARRWDVSPEHKADPQAVHDSRMAAAITAFDRAIERNRNRWEAYYALAVHRMTRLKQRREEAGFKQLDAEDLDSLREVVRLCDRVIAMSPRNAEAHDLKGMALWMLVKARAPSPDIEGAISCHRRAVRLTWSNLCREERLAKAVPPTTETVLTKRQENATAALHNLARAYALKADRSEGAARTLNYRRADVLFKQAIKLAPIGSAAASHFERARTLRLRGRREIEALGENPSGLGSTWRRSRALSKLGQARAAYSEAATREPENPLYAAQLARAHADAGGEWSAVERATEHQCKAALESLAPVWRRSLSPTTPARADERVTRRTFHALHGAYTALERLAPASDKPTMQLRAARVEEMAALETKLPHEWGAIQPDGGWTVEVFKEAHRLFRESLRPDAEELGEPGRGVWEAEQIGVALARAEAAYGALDPALRVLERLIAFVTENRRRALQVHELEIRKGQVFRKLGQHQRALEAISSGLMRDPLSDRGNSELAETHMLLWQYDEALRSWEHSLSLKPNDPYVHFKLGLCHWWRAQGQRDRREVTESLSAARSLIEQSHDLFSREDVYARAWLRLWRGRIDLERGAFGDAVMHLRAARSYDWTRVPALVLLGEAYVGCEEFGLAREALDSAITPLEEQSTLDVFDRDWGECLRARQLRARCRRASAVVRLKQEDFRGALDEIDAALQDADKIRPLEERALILALCYDTQALAILGAAETSAAEQGSVEDAEQTLHKAIAIRPFPDALLHMAQLHEMSWERQPDPVERARLVTRVVKIRHEIDHLAGDGEVAREVAEIAQRLDETNYIAVGAHTPPDTPAGSNGDTL